MQLYIYTSYLKEAEKSLIFEISLKSFKIEIPY